MRDSRNRESASSKGRAKAERLLWLEKEGGEQRKDGEVGRGDWLTDHGEEVDPPDDERAGAAHPPSVPKQPDCHGILGTGSGEAGRRCEGGRGDELGTDRWRRTPKAAAAAAAAVARAECVWVVSRASLKATVAA